GYIANMFLKHGADIEIFDLFPDQNVFCPIQCQKIDLQNNLPLENQSADLIICSETIEHIPNQYHFFGEVSRVLKTGGTLILTTPNTSSLRSRFSQFVGESEHYNHPLPHEGNVFTKYPGQEEGYFAKLFISGVLRLRTLAAINGLEIVQIHQTKSSSTSWLLLVFYPIIWLFARKNYKKQIKNEPDYKRTLDQIYHINTSIPILLSRHLIMEFRKKND
ncbi:MAG: class I SAM-dependent methyltransferase, partial [Saprospiraceae bacterium]